MTTSKKSSGLIEGTKIGEMQAQNNQVADGFDGSNFTLIKGGSVRKFIMSGNTFGGRSEQNDRPK